MPKLCSTGRNFFSNGWQIWKNDENRNSIFKIDDFLNTTYQNKNDVMHEIMKFITNDDCQNKKIRNFCISMADCEIRNQKLFYRDRFFVFENADNKFEIIKSIHNLFSTKYKKWAKTFVLIICNCSFPSYNKFVTQLVKTCHIYFKSKTSTKSSNAFLKPLPVPEQKWKKKFNEFCFRFIQ